MTTREPQEAHSRTQEPGADSEHRENERSLVRWTRVVAFLTGGLVFVGAITGFIFWKQLGAMQGQLDAMEREGRPYIGIPTITNLPEFRAVPDNQGFIIWTWNAKNSGKSLAKDITFDEFMKVGNAPYVYTFGDKVPGFVSEVAPDGTFYHSARSAPGIDQAQFQALASTNRALGLLIEMTYKSESGKSYSYAICFEKLANLAIALIAPADCQKQ